MHALVVGRKRAISALQHGNVAHHAIVGGNAYAVYIYAHQQAGVRGHVNLHHVFAAQGWGLGHFAFAPVGVSSV